MRLIQTLAASILACSAFASPLASPCVHEDVRLAWKLKEGEVLRYRMVQDSHQTITGPGEFEVSSTVSQVIREKVKSVSPDGVASLECTWEAVKVHMTQPMVGEMDFDSTQAGSAQSAPGPLKGFANLPGATFEMDMKPTGEVVTLHGISDAMKKVFSADDPSTRQIRDMMERSFNDDSMKHNLETAILPEKPVAVGGKWARDTEFELHKLGKMKAHFDFTFTGMEDQGGGSCAKVNAKYEMTMGPSKPDMSSSPGGEHMDVDLTMDDAGGEGTIHFSPEKGRLVHSALVTDMDMNMSIKPKGQDKGDEGKMEMAIKATLKLTVSLLGADEPAFEAAASKESAAKDPKAKKG